MAKRRRINAQVALVSDKEAEMAAAAADVKAGSLLDDDDLPGIAHLLEHMLFFSSKPYPKEDEYRQFISEHGGSTNAFTSQLDTCFFFSVKPGALDEALDRFANFFKAPLFDRNGVEREVHAVNNESQRNVSSESWRELMVWKLFSNHCHPISKYSTGDLETLKHRPEKLGIDVHNRLIDFHRRHYSSAVMTGCIYSCESLDHLESMALEHFSGIENTGEKRPEISGECIPDATKRTLIKMVPTVSQSSLKLLWEIPPQERLYRSHPCDYVSHLLGHEAKGSVDYYLKKKGLASELIAGEGGMSFSGSSFFYVKVVLSEEGMDRVKEVGEAIFDFLNAMREAGPQKWAWEEKERISRLRFDFKSRPNAAKCAMEFASTLQVVHEDPESVALVASNVPQEFNPDAIDEVLQHLTADNVQCLWSSPQFAGQCTNEEPHYHAQYTSKPLPQEWLESWRKPSRNREELHLHRRNQFLPESLDLLEPSQSTKHPTLEWSSPLLRLWWKPDTEFQKAPKATCHFDIRCPDGYASPSAVVMTSLFVSLLHFNINEVNYEAAMAGLGAHFQNNRWGLRTIIAAEFSDKLQKLVSLVIAEIANFQFRDADFEVIKQRQHESYKNRRVEHAYQRALYSAVFAQEEGKFHFQNYLDTIENISPDDLRNHVKRLLSRCSIDMLAVGHISLECAKGIASDLTSTLSEQCSTRALLPEEMPLPRVVKLPLDAPTLFEEVHESEYEMNSSSSVVFQAGTGEREGVITDLLSRILKERAFAQLRTREQLGYIVTASSQDIHHVHFLVVLLQSSEYNAPYQQSRIEAFLDGVDHALFDMDESEFADYRAGLLAKMRFVLLSPSLSHCVNRLILHRFRARTQMAGRNQSLFSRRLSSSGARLTRERTFSTGGSARLRYWNRCAKRTFLPSSARRCMAVSGGNLLSMCTAGSTRRAWTARWMTLVGLSLGTRSAGALRHISAPANPSLDAQ